MIQYELKEKIIWIFAMLCTWLLIQPKCYVSTIEKKSKEEPFNSITLPKPSFIILLMNSSNERVIMRKINQLKKRSEPLLNNHYKMYTKEDNHPLIADQKLYKKSLRVCLFDLRKKPIKYD